MTVLLAGIETVFSIMFHNVTGTDRISWIKVVVGLCFGLFCLVASIFWLRYIRSKFVTRGNGRASALNRKNSETPNLIAPSSNQPEMESDNPDNDVFHS